ncbi:MAG: HlyD family efflux transporter periplasmic adaptor subunit [Muribaculaceae bacterium]|nr:HlyD family efflux transporter periplasmic adaptor subunit [Muribaculaceae bacterium]MDE6553678.1 HlyD family efflux transporter periplasmic adaptor subunit [Muribaculaceae bacterium]
MDTEIKRKNPQLRKFFIPAMLGIAVLTAIGWAMIASRTSSYNADSRNLMVREVTEGEFNDYIHLSGKVETGFVVQVSALETGIVEQKLLEEGAMVNEGDVILTLRNPLLRQQILDSESQLAERQNMLRDTELAMEKERLQVKRDILAARTELNRKRRVADQQKSLLDENLTSREQYLTAKEDYELAKENLNLLEDRLRQDSAYRSVQVAMMRESLHNMQENFMLVRQRADNLNVKATHSGQLGSLTAEIGQNISAGQQVGQINILDNYKLSVQIDEHYIDRIEPGLSGKASRQGREFEVTVAKVYPEVVDGQFKADLAITGSVPEKPRVGQSYPVDIQLGSPVKAVMIDKGSFFQSSGGKYVYVVSPDGKSAEKRVIKLGRRNPKYYEVLEGLSPGEKVIVSSYSDFGEADRLSIND